MQQHKGCDFNGPDQSCQLWASEDPTNLKEFGLDNYDASGILLLQELLGGRENKWSLNELVVAIVYLCHFHTLASFVLGCGLTNEPTAETPLPEQSKDTELVSNILKKMEDLMSHMEELDISEVARRFETVNEESRHLSDTAKEAGQEIKIVDPTKYTQQMEFQYVDFVKRANPEMSPTFRSTVRVHPFFIS